MKESNWIRRDIEAECRKFRQDLTFYQNTDTFVTTIESMCRTYRILHPNSTTTMNDSERVSQELATDYEVKE